MYKLKLVLVTVAVIKLVKTQTQSVSPYTGSLADCIALTDKFDFTENLNYDVDTLKYPYTTAYQMVECDEGGICPDGVFRQFCQWQRFLRVQCTASGDGAEFKIITNSLPNHCFYAENDYPLGSTSYYNAYGVEGKFNLRPTQMAAFAQDTSNSAKIYTTIANRADIDAQLCQPQWAKTSAIDTNLRPAETIYTSTTNTPAYYSSWSSPKTVASLNLIRLYDSDQVVGVALNGVFIFTGTSEYGYDMYFPKNYNNPTMPDRIPTDACLGSQQTNNVYRYHMYSPCIYDIAMKKQILKCSQSASCSQDVRRHAIDHTPISSKGLQPIGLAKDGRVIYGPFKVDGSLWRPCDVDVCNGRYFGNNYGYVATMFHPYVVSCWGPGNKIVRVKQGCSANPRFCSAGSNLLVSSFVISFGFIMGALALIF
ncbi:UNKNOWN [Stylonychia lemnae]|uniref:YHYH domain-containing protein n=1 Tax=Stylonychia lemnae TaxID=5949 RepID=A0A078AXR9_STYLE|nr:UNKNOWN [Stylonychia lemnae]|eukprot:CDW86032.1 UNKNOWN [Stylonychia lemnae]